MVYAKSLWIFWIIAISWAFVLNAYWSGSKIVPKDYPTIIGCINQYTWEIKKPLNQTYSACYHGTKWWKNLRFPSKTQFKLLREVFKNKRGMVTAMTIINHESQFDKNAKWCHKWGCDYGIFQIRDVNGWKNMTQKQQMEWFANRKAWQLSPKWNCFRRVEEWNSENIIKCVFARHHWDLQWTARYPTARFEEWKFYKSINF